MNILVVGNIIKDVYLDFAANLFEIDREKRKVFEITLDEEPLFFNTRTSVLSGTCIAKEVLENFRLEVSETQQAEDVRYIIKSEKSVKYLTSKYAKPSRFLPPKVAPDWLFIDRSARLEMTTISRILAYLEDNPKVRLAISTGDKLEKILISGDNFVANKLLKMLAGQAEMVFLSGQKIEPLELKKNQNTRLLVEISPNLVKIHDLVSKTIINTKLVVGQKQFLTNLSIYSVVASTMFAAIATGWNLDRAMRFSKSNLQQMKVGKTLNIDQLYAKLQRSLKKEAGLEILARSLVADDRGILAIDESKKTIRKKLREFQLDDSRRTSEKYREILVTTPGLQRFLNGVILSQETISQKLANGQLIPRFLSAQGVLPGVKADLGLVNLPGMSGQFRTEGLVDLSSRLENYAEQGLRFTKWRAVFWPDESGVIPEEVIEQNTTDLVKYAEIVLQKHLIPILEPEVMRGRFKTTEKSSEISQYFENTKKVLTSLVHKMEVVGLNFASCLLKINMVYARENKPEETAKYTMRLLDEVVPTEIGGVVFLSGGQSPEQSTINLKYIMQLNQGRFRISFSFGRAIADPALIAWNNRGENIKLAQDKLIERLNETCKVLKTREN